MRDGEITHQAAAGKKLLKIMAPDQHHNLLLRTRSITYDGDMRISHGGEVPIHRAWKIHYQPYPRGWGPEGRSKIIKYERVR